MSAQIKYAYLKGHTWLYRRNYPQEVAVVLGSQALKQSLKTGDRAVARVRSAEMNARFEQVIVQVRTGAEEVLSDQPDWVTPSPTALDRLRATLEASGNTGTFQKLRAPQKVAVQDTGRAYLNRRSNELRPSGFKSVRYSVGLFLSHYGDRSVCSLGREEGRAFLGLIAQLSPLIGKGETTRRMGLTQLVAWSQQDHRRITVRTQKRIWSQVNHFLDWCVYEGQLEQNPFKSVLFDQRVRPAPYAVPTDQEVVTMLGTQDTFLRPVLLTCLLSGLRAGEAVGLLREDIVSRGNLGHFIHVRPNSQRLLKTDAAERLVPLHPALQSTFDGRPMTGPLFPDLNVNTVTKRFAKLRVIRGIERPGLVFHSSRKWFITQCERTGVPEHFTASLVGHQSARSENGITYGIYSAGISDEQRRGIVDQIWLPVGVTP